MTFKKDRLKKNVVLGSDNSFIKYFECEENELHAISTDDSGQRDREANRLSKMGVRGRSIPSISY